MCFGFRFFFLFVCYAYKKALKSPRKLVVLGCMNAKSKLETFPNDLECVLCAKLYGARGFDSSDRKLLKESGSLSNNFRLDCTLGVVRIFSDLHIAKQSAILEWAIIPGLPGLSCNGDVNACLKCMHTDRILCPVSLLLRNKQDNSPQGCQYRHNLITLSVDALFIVSETIGRRNI